MADNKNAVAMLDESKKKLEVLTQRRTRIQVELETARRQFQEACDEAKKEFGTSDLGELRELYRTREAENNTKALDFAMAVEEAEAQLHEIEQKAV